MWICLPNAPALIKESLRYCIFKDLPISHQVHGLLRFVSCYVTMFGNVSEIKWTWLTVHVWLSGGYTFQRSPHKAEAIPKSSFFYPTLNLHILIFIKRFLVPNYVIWAFYMSWNWCVFYMWFVENYNELPDWIMHQFLMWYAKTCLSDAWIITYYVALHIIICDLWFFNVRYNAALLDLMCSMFNFIFSMNEHTT